MRAARESDFDGSMWRLYEYITRHFLGTISGNCRYKKTKVTFDIGGEIFTCSGKRILNPGFYNVMPWLRLNEVELPDMTGIQSCNLLNTNLKVGQTQPPGYLTESELIGLVSNFFIKIICISLYKICKVFCNILNFLYCILAVVKIITKCNECFFLNM